MKNSEFIFACREGGRAIENALRELDRSFFTLLYREARRVIRDADLARDLVQETFIKVWRRCATYRGDSELMPWIRAVMRHTILDHLRSRQSQEAIALGEAPTPIAQDMSSVFAREIATPHQEVVSMEAAACFSECWERFAAACPEHATVIAWIAYDGLDHAQIAALLERSPGATREFISQCRKRAREYLADWYGLAFGPDSSNSRGGV